MSKRVVLAALFLLAGLPMVLSEVAPVGAAVALAGLGLLALPRLARATGRAGPRRG